MTNDAVDCKEPIGGRFLMIFAISKLMTDSADFNQAFKVNIVSVHCSRCFHYHVFHKLDDVVT